MIYFYKIINTINYYTQYLKMSEFQPINIADGEEEIIVFKKTKKVKSKLLT